MKKLILALFLILCSISLSQAGMLIGSGTTDTTAPTLTSSTIPTAGTSISLLFSETVSIGAGGNAGWTIVMTGGVVTMAYSSGNGSNTLVYTLSRTVNSGETGTVAYVQPGDGIEDTSGNDLATIVTAAVTNNSTQGSITYLYSGGGGPYDHQSGVIGTNTAIASRITTVDAVTLISIGVNIVPGTATACKIALYDNASNLIFASGTVTNPVDGWNDLSISYATSAATTYQIWCMCNSSDWKINYTSNYTGGYNIDMTYATFPVANISWGNDDNAENGSRAGY